MPMITEAIEIDASMFDGDEETLHSIETMLAIISKESRNYANTDSVYQENNIETILPDCFKRWPAPPSILNFDTSSPYEYYEDMLYTMIHSYMGYAIKNKDMLSYEDVRKNCPNFVDLYLKTKKYSENFVDKDDDNSIYNTFRTSPTLKEQNWKAFIPKTDELSIRINKNKYMHIDVLKRNMKTKSAQLEISMYTGNRNEWVIMNKLNIDIIFCPQKNKIGFEWKLNSIMPYEVFLTKNIESMNWSKEQKCLWQDAFNAYPIQELKKMTVGIYDADNQKKPFQNISLMVSNVQTQKELRKHSNSIIKVDYESDNEQAVTELNDKSEQRLVIAYIKTITLVNMLDELIETWENGIAETTKIGED